MTRPKALYEDVVVGGEPPTQQVLTPRKIVHEEKSEPQEVSETSDEEGESSDTSDQEGKDDKPQAKMESVRERLSEDPFMTQAEMKNMDGGSKEKGKKSDEKDSKKKDPDKKAKDEQKKSKKELDVLVSRSNKILLHAKSIFPFDFFPNTLTIDANKVDIVISTFFYTETVTSVLLKEIMDVRVEISLFMGKLIIDYGPHPLKISTVYVPTLWKKDALKAKEIIEGMLVVYRAENIDTTKLKPEETIEEIKEVGRVEE
ncbi:MAG TPA: hypothetical protein VM077_04880 [Candidatus Limnocylindrales bacterium]|nr:hypothetical protein [Candidatus Limnocylindrales bacterium]